MYVPANFFERLREPRRAPRGRARGNARGDAVADDNDDVAFVTGGDVEGVVMSVASSPGAMLGDLRVATSPELRARCREPAVERRSQ